MNNLKIPFSAPLNEQDTETQTYGCRLTNPDVCSRNGMPDVCAFASRDHICKKPSRLWRDQYIKLSKGSVIEITEKEEKTTMTVGKLMELLQGYDEDDIVAVAVYDIDTDAYIDIDENPTVDDDGYDFVLKVKVEADGM